MATAAGPQSTPEVSGPLNRLPGTAVLDTTPTVSTAAAETDGPPVPPPPRAPRPEALIPREIPISRGERGVVVEYVKATIEEMLEYDRELERRGIQPAPEPVPRMPLPPSIPGPTLGDLPEGLVDQLIAMGIDVDAIEFPAQDGPTGSGTVNSLPVQRTETPPSSSNALRDPVEPQASVDVTANPDGSLRLAGFGDVSDAQFSGVQTKSVAQKAPALTQTLPALEDNGGTFPPDPMGAVGPNHLMVVSNQRFRIQDRSGNILQTIGIGSFWSPLAGVQSPFDPKIIWDPLGGRFLIVADSNRRSAGSSVLFAISSTQNPLDPWHMYRIDADETDTLWADFPYIGTSSDRITISQNMFTMTDAFSESRIWVFEKAEAFNGGTLPFTRFSKTGTSALAAALTFDAGQTTQVMIHRLFANLSGKSFFQMYTVSGTPTNPVFNQISTRPTSLPWSSTNVDAPQMNTTSLLDTGDDRIQHVVLRGGRLWVVNSVALPVSGSNHHAVHWAEINVDTATTVQSNFIDDFANGGFSYWFPAIAVNKNNEVLIGFSGSASTTFASAYYTFRDPSMPLGAMQPVSLLQAGQNTYTRSRWGDYTGAAIDPADDTTMWLLQMFASATSNRFDTIWGRLGGGAPVSPAPEVSGAAPQSGTTVRITFNKPMTNNSALTSPSSYTFSGGGASLSAQSVTRLNETQVDVTVNKMTNGASYTALVKTTAPGPTDLGGQLVNPAANSASFTGLGPAATVQLTSATSSPTNADPIPVSVTFSEPVNGFTASDIVTTNASVTNFTGASGSATYSFGLVPTDQGSVSASIPAGAAQDLGNNNTAASSTFSRSFDNVRPAVSLSSTSPSTTNSSPIPVTVTFTEAVNGFTLSDVAITNGTGANFQSVTGASYTFNIVPAADGPVTASIAGGAAQDAAGNTNTTSSVFSRTFDATAPTLTLSSSVPAGATSTTPIPVTVTFSESVTGFTASDITTTNATVANFSGSGANYTFDLTPSNQGNVTAAVPSNAAQDAAGNGNAASAQFSRTFDSVGPTVVLSSVTSSPSTNSSPIPVTITFNEGVFNFDINDISVTGGTKGGFTGSSGSAVYSFNLTPSSQGPVSANVAAGVANDVAGNPNQAASAVFTRTFDSVSPATTLSSSASSITNVSPIPFTVSFGEPMSGFTASDVSVTNGTVTNFVGADGDSSYSFGVVPGVQGLVTVQVAAGVAQDSAGNPNLASSQVSRTFDSGAPLPILSTTAPDPTNQSPIPVTVNFGEPVNGFVAGEVMVTNGAVVNFAGMDGDSVYTFGVTPGGQGQVSVSIAANVAQDLAGNNNTASATLNRTFDSIAPSVTLSTSAPVITNTSPIPFTATFSEGVTGFVAGDITVTNGSVVNFSGSSGGSTYTFGVSPAAQGVVNVSINSAVAQDLAGNNNTASNQISRTFDNVKPTASLASSAPTNTNVAPIPFSVSFGEGVTGFVAGDITVTNGSVVNFVGNSGDASYTFGINPTANGAVSVQINANVAQDLAGNTNNASGQVTRTFDSAAPAAVLTSSAPSITNVAPIPFSVNFGEPVNGFVAGDLTVTNGSVVNFVGGNGSSVFTFDINPAGQGAVSVRVPGSVADDLAGNSNTASAQVTRTFDSVAPGVALSSSAPNPTNTSPIPFTATFTEPVNNFVAGDLTVTNGSVVNFVGGNGDAVFTFGVNPTAQGAVSVQINANVAQDLAGNNNTAATQIIRTFDSVGPTVTMTPTGPNPTNQTPIAITVQFSEPVTGFTLSDIATTNAGANSFNTVNASQYTFNLVPSGSGPFTVTATVPANSAVDSAGNGNQLGSVSRQFDGASPQAVLTSSAPATTNVSPVPFSVDFGEGVTGFTSGDLIVTNGSVVNFSGASGSATYTFGVNPAGQGTVTVEVPAAAAQDAAGNNNLGSGPVSRVFDSAAPAPVVTSSAPQNTNVSPVPFSVNFGEAVTGFVAGDITVTNGSVVNFSGASGSSTYTFAVNPAGQGTVSVQILAGVAQDLVGNANTASTQVGRVFDTAAPAAVLTSSAPQNTNVSPVPFSVNFGEAVTGFDASDITTNGTVTNFTGASGSSTYTFGVIPVGPGPVTAQITADKAQDLAGNNNTASAQISRTFDTAAPTATLTSSAPATTNTAPIPFTVTFNEPVNNFVSGDLAVTNGSVVNFVGGNGVSTFTFGVNPTTQGAVTVQVPNNVATDLAGNNNVGSAQVSRTFDTGAPTPVVSSSAPTNTNTSPIPFSVNFGEPVNGFVAGDVTFTNGTISGFTGNDGDSVYTFNITPSSQGAVTVQVAAGVAADLGGNANLASTQISRTFDSIAPAPVLTSTAPQNTNTSPVPFSVNFGEGVTGFTAADITTSGTGTVTGFTGASGSATYTFSVIPSGQGNVSAQIVAGGAQDLAGNLNTASAVVSRTFDSVAPTPVVTSSATEPTNVSPIPFSVNFGEGVTGFVAADITTNGTVVNFAGNSGDQTYTFGVVPPGEVIVSVQIGAGVANDLAGNANGASTQVSRTYNNSNPLPVITSPGTTNPTNLSVIPITVTFSEPVNGFTASDVVVANATLNVASFTGGNGDSVFTFNLTSPSGAVTVDVPAGVATDGAANPNDAAATFSVTIDTTAPAAVLTSSAPAATNVSPIPFAVDFGEPVNGFASGDVVTNGTVVNFTGANGDATYTFGVTPPGQGAVNVQIPAAAATDRAGNANTASAQVTRTFDNVRPTVALSGVSGFSNANPQLITATFSEPVSGFTLADVVTNGTVNTLTGADGSAVYTFNVVPPGQGTVTVEIAANAAQDAAGNTSQLSPQLSWVFDSVAPTAVLTSSAPTNTNVSPIPFAVNFGEPVNGFVAGDVTVTNGTVTNFVGANGDSVYTFSVNPSGQGAVSAQVNAAVATDRAGNSNLASALVSRTFDTQGPTVAMTTGSANPTNSSPITVTATFSEGVTGFTIGDVLANNATVGNFTGNSGDSVYTFNLTPAGPGQVTADIGAGAALDAAGNPNAAAPQFAITFDNRGPTPVITSSVSNPTNVSPIPITVTFDEPTNGFTAGDVIVANATLNAGSFTGGNGDTVFTFNLTSPSGTVTVNINAGVATDALGNANLAATQFSVVFDNTAPTTTLTANTASPTRTSPIPFTVTFSEPVNGFTASDITTNGSVVNFVVVSSANYTFGITPPGTLPTVVNVSAQIAGGVATDAAGNNNAASALVNMQFDNVRPTLAMSSAAANPTNLASIPVTVIFDETVTNFTAADIAPTNATVSNFSGSGANYSFNLNPTNQGTVAANVANNAAFDLAGNGNIAAAQFSRTFDSVAPTVTSITSTTPSTTGQSPIPVQVVFSEPVFNFAAGDIVTNGTVSGFTGAGGSTTYSFNVTPPGGPRPVVVSVQVAANGVQDAAGNNNPASAVLQRTFDDSLPTVVINSSAPTVTNVSPIPFTVTFSETVFGFTASDLVLGNGLANNFTAQSGAVYTFNLVPQNQGLVTVNVPAGAAQDDAGNDNEAAVQFSRTFDTNPPTAVISSTANSSTNVQTIPITVTFNEPVTGFVAGDVVVTNGSVVGASFNAAGNPVFTFNITATAEGPVTVNVPAGVATDTAGNNNLAAAQLTRTYDVTAPGVAISSSTSATTNVNPIPVTVAFTEPVTGFVAGDVVVTNGTLQNFAGSGANYSFNVVPIANGQVTVNIAQNVAQDAAGNQNTPAPQFTRQFDSVAPTVVLGTSAASPSSAGSIPVTVQFSEPVFGFTASDLAVTNGVVANFTGADGSATFTFNLNAANDGVATVSVAQGAATDAAGNPNAAAASLSHVFDRGAPALTLTSTLADPTSTSPIPVRAAFTEPVFGFTLADVVVTNGSAGAFTGADGGSVYTFDVTPNAQGLVSVDVAAGAAQDAAGNNSTAAAPFTITFDSISPTVAVSTTAPAQTNLTQIPVTIVFSEPVTDFIAADVAITNAILNNFTGSGTTYTFDLVAQSNGPVTATVPAGVAHDAAGNANSAAPQGINVTFDTIAPVTTLTSAASPDTNLSPIPVTVTFSEPVFGFTLADLVPTQGSASNFVGADGNTVFTFNLTPSAQGLVSVSVPAGAAQDAAGNANTAASLARTFDSVGPSVALNTTVSEPANVSLIPVTVQFSEPVMGFTASDITVSQATVGDFQAVSGAEYTFILTPLTEPAVVSAQVLAGAAQDAAGNPNAPSNLLTRTFEGEPPAVVLTTTASDPTNVSPIPVLATFSEDVTGFTAGDITASNATLANFQSVSAAVYTFDLVPVNDGDVSANIAAGVAQDTAGNPNTAATFLVRFDTTGPVVVLSSTEPPSTNKAKIPITATFNEPVTGFTLADVSVTGGLASDFAPIDAMTYAFFVNAAADGTVTVHVAASVAQDAAGNGNTAAAPLTRTIDTTPPVVQSITINDPSPTAAQVVAFTVTFSESVTGVDSADFALFTEPAQPIQGAAVTSVTGAGAAYTVQVNSGTGSGLLRLDLIDNDTIKDTVGNPLGGPGPNNGNFASGQAYQLDRSAPTIEIRGPFPEAANRTSTVRYEVVYTDVDEITLDRDDIGLIIQNLEENVNQQGVPGVVTGVTAKVLALPPFVDQNAPNADIAIENTSPTVRTLVLTNLTGDGFLSLLIAAGTARDNHGNQAGGDVASDQVRVDNKRPTVVVTPLDPILTNLDRVRYSLRFSEAVEGFFNRDHVNLAGTLASSVTFTLDPANLEEHTYTVTITPNDPFADGTIGIEINPAVTDLVKNPIDLATFSAQTYEIDNTPPAFSISTPSAPAATNGPVTYTITYTGADRITLDPRNVTLNRTGSAFGRIGVTGEGTTQRIVTISDIIGDGTLGITLQADTARDAVGNRAAASGPSQTFVVDNTPLSMTVSPPAPAVVSGGPLRFTVAYLGATEITLGPADVTLVREGTADGQVTVSGLGATERIITIANVTGDGQLGIQIAADTARDLVGERAPAFGPSVLARVDNTPPTALIGPPSVTALRTGLVTFSVTYSEPATITLAPSDVTLVRTGSATGTLNVSGTGDTQRTVTISDIAGDGTLGIVIAAGTASDAAGHVAPAPAPSALVTVDNQRPSVTVNQAPGQADPAAVLPVLFDVLFSEPVTGFSTADVAMGGTAGGVTFAVEGSGAQYVIRVTGVATPGTLIPTIPAGAAGDAVGNTNAASSSTDNLVLFDPSSGGTCNLGQVTIMFSSQNARFVVPQNASKPVPLTITSKTDCPEKTLKVSYFLDGAPLGEATAPPYAVTIPNVYDLPGGEHVVTARATSTSTPPTIVVTQKTFTVVRRNTTQSPSGIPSDPFTVLEGDGDTWLSTETSEETGGSFVVGVTAWGGAAAKGGEPGPITIALESPDDPDVDVEIIAPRELLLEGETGSLIVRLAADPATLFGLAEAERLAPGPLGGLVANGHYVEVSVIISTDGGLTFDEIDGGRLAANPVRFTLTGIEVSPSTAASLYAHPTLVDNPGAGITIFVQEGDWTKDHASNVQLMDRRMEADLVHLSLFAPFYDLAPVISVTPDGHNFGQVNVGQTREVTFTVRNMGDGDLSGAVTVPAPFNVVGTASYNLGPGQQTAVRISFTPQAAGAVSELATFTGGGGATVLLTGTGVTGGAQCAASGAVNTFTAADPAEALLLMLVAAGLVLRHRARARRR